MFPTGLIFLLWGSWVPILPVRSGSARSDELRACEGTVGLAPTEQLLVRALIDDPARLHHNNPVCVHNSAQAVRNDQRRPARTEFIERIAQLFGAAVLGRPVSDTLKRVRDGLIESTVDRRELFRAETPQVFRRDLLERAFESAETSGLPEATDESSLVERLGESAVAMVVAEWPNPKLTVAGDLPLLASLLAESSLAGSRTA